MLFDRAVQRAFNTFAAQSRELFDLFAQVTPELIGWLDVCFICHVVFCFHYWGMPYFDPPTSL